MKRINIPINTRKPLLELRNHRTCLLLALVVILTVASVFLFDTAAPRFAQACRDLGESVMYWGKSLGNMLFGADFELVKPSVTSLDFGWNAAPTEGGSSALPGIFLPESFALYKTRLSLYLLVFNMQNFQSFFASFATDLQFILMLSMLLIIPAVICIKVLFAQVLKKENNDYNHNSKGVVIWTKFAARIGKPIKVYLQSIIEYMRCYKLFGISLTLLALYTFNILSVAVATLSYYLYFATAFDFSGIYIQLYKLCVDLSPAFIGYAWWLWVPFLISWVLKKRRQHALHNLDAFEYGNAATLDKFGIIVMNVGSMGKSKTTLLTDMALTQQNKFRQKADDLMVECQSMFPHFPWIVFEKILQRAMSEKRIYNLRSCRKFVDVKKARFSRRPCPEKLYGYDIYNNPMQYDNKLDMIDLFKVLDDYARLYFIFVASSSLIVANLAVRDDAVLYDKGNFPIFDCDFFRRNADDIEALSTQAHILDFDMLRMGRTLIVDNHNKNAFEFGVVCITEIAKERGNQNDFKELKKNVDECNQKNDYFDRWLKLCRHLGTIMNYPFVKVFTDDQRPDALGADIRQLCDVLYIDSVSERKISLMFFSVAMWFHDIVFDKFAAFFKQFRFNRADNTLLLRLYKRIGFGVHRYVENSYNRFGYKQVKIHTNDGMTDNLNGEFDYFLVFKKIYSRRFATDSFNDILSSRECTVGLNDLECYSDVRPTAEEFRKQNSYVIHDLDRFMDSKKEENNNK